MLLPRIKIEQRKAQVGRRSMSRCFSEFDGRKLPTGISSYTAVSEAHFMLLESLSFVSWTAMQVSGH